MRGFYAKHHAPSPQPTIRPRDGSIGHFASDGAPSLAHHGPTSPAPDIPMHRRDLLKAALAAPLLSLLPAQRLLA
ncbi:MAG TPA: hypothetical protein VLZ32_06925, partial [Rhodanobacter sp.]|nr:hypothetical protein [Rhodanobacter sp.]